MDPAWFQKHKTELMIGGGGVAVTIALYMRSKSKAAGTAAGGSAVTSSYGNPATAVDTTTSDLYNNLSGQIQGLGTSVAALTAQNQKTAYTPPANETLFGAGYGAPGQTTQYASSTTPVAGMDGGAYYSMNDAQIWGAVSNGQPFYSQVNPGDFQIAANVNSGPVFSKSPH
jgi:hypothetical protein